MTIRPVRELAKDEVVEGEVLVGTKIITEQGSVLRYCTVANCTVEGAGRAEHCLMLTGGPWTVGELWDMAATSDDAGHLAMPTASVDDG